jgi:hypothetical protein
MTPTAYDTITTDGDYRMFLRAGPFSITPGDTLVVDMAIVAGTSLSDLLANANETKSYWQIVPVETESNNRLTFDLAQNYSNPFNPSKKIKYSVPQSSNLIIKVFDVLGNEIATLVNEEKPAGEYEVEFNVAQLSRVEMASGIYFYQLKAGGPETSSGQGYIETKKMILLK